MDPSPLSPEGWVALLTILGLIGALIGVLGGSSEGSAGSVEETRPRDLSRERDSRALVRSTEVVPVEPIRVEPMLPDVSHLTQIRPHVFQMEVFRESQRLLLEIRAMHQNILQIHQALLASPLVHRALQEPISGSPDRTARYRFRIHDGEVVADDG